MSKYTINLNISNPRKLTRLTHEIVLNTIFATNPKGCKVYFDPESGFKTVECENRPKDLPELELHWLEVKE